MPLGTWFRGNLRELFADTLLSPASAAARLLRAGVRPPHRRRAPDRHSATTRCACGSSSSSRSGTSSTSIIFHSPHRRLPKRDGGSVNLRNFAARFRNSAGTCLAQVTQVESAVPVAVVMTSFEPGGTERQMTELVRRLDPSRWEVHLACFRTTGPMVRTCRRALPYRSREFPVTSFMHPSIVRHVWDFARWCRRRRIAIVQATEIYSNIFALPAAALGGVAVASAVAVVSTPTGAGRRCLCSASPTRRLPT